MWQISMSVTGRAWDRMGLDAALDSVGDCLEFRNERPSGYGDDEGEWFAVVEGHAGADGKTYHILFTGTHGNDHSPMTSGNTFATLFDVASPIDMAEFRPAVAEWEAKPERLDDESGDPEPESA
jgi:hypothetical protein